VPGLVHCGDSVIPSSSSSSSSSPHHGSCSPPIHSNSSSPYASPVAAQHATAQRGVPAGLAAAAAASQKQQQSPEIGSDLPTSPEPCQQQQQQQQDLALPAAAADAQELLWSAAAAESWAQGFAPDSTLLGPFEALAKAQAGTREGMCRIGRVQHGGELKGIWQTPGHKVVLHEKVGGRPGMCRRHRVQLSGRPEGVPHTPSYREVLYERVGGRVQDGRQRKGGGGGEVLAGSHAVMCSFGSSGTGQWTGAARWRAERDQACARLQAGAV
jgi:hypothetical protein